MRLFTDFLCWIAAWLLSLWWKRENNPVRSSEHKPIAQARGVAIYSLNDFRERREKP